MEHKSSFNKQLRKEITARAVMNKEIKSLQENIDINFEEIYNADMEIKRIKKVILKRKKKNRTYTDLSLRVNKLNISKTDLKNKIEALKQIISHIEQAKEEVKLKIKQLKKKIKNLPIENPFDFTDYVIEQEEENEIDLGLFLELAEENKIIYNQVPINTLIEDMEKLKNGFFTNGYFTLGEEGEIDTNRFFKDSDELAKFIDKILDKYDNHPSIYYTGNIYRYFKNYKRINRSEHGRGANEFNNIEEYNGENCYIPSGNGCFLKCINYIFDKDFSIEYFEFIKSYKRRQNVMSRCRIPEFCKRYKIDIGIYDLNSKRILPWTVKQKNICVHIHRNHYFVIWKKNRKDSLLNGVNEIDKNFKYIKNKINKDNLKQRIRYRFPKYEKIDQLKNVFVFDLETQNDQEFAETYAAGLYDVNRLRECWHRDLTPHELVIERKNVTVFDASNGNCIMNMLKYISENYDGDERTYIDRDGDEIVSSYRLLLVAHNSSGFDSWVVLNSLIKDITDLKIIKTARGLISLSFRCGVKIVNTCEVPQYVKFTCTKPHIKGSLEKIGKEYGLQPELLKGEMDHSLINKNNFAELRHIWEPYLISDVLCLAFIYARHSMEMQKMTGFGIKDCLTEASLGWKCFGTYNKDGEFYTFNDKYVRDFIRKSIKGGRVGAFNRYFESNQFDEIMSTIKKHLKINDNEISNIIDKYLKYINTKRNEFKLEFENGEKDYRKINKKELDKFLEKKLGKLNISKELQEINKDDLLVSYDFNSLYPSAQIDKDSNWPKIETAYPFKKFMNDAICTLFNSGRWNELNRSAFLTIKYHNPENLIFQHLPVKEKIENPYKKNRFEEINRMRNGIIIDTLTSVDIVEIVKYGGEILEVYEGFFCYNLEFNPYTEFVTDMFQKRDLFKSQGKDLLQNLAKKIGLSVYGGNIRKDINEEYKCVTENWMRENFDDRVKEWFPLKNGNLIVKLEDDEGVDDFDKAKSINTMPSHFGSYILSHSKRLMNNVFREIDGFYSNNIYYGDTDSGYIHKKHWSTLVEKGFVGKTLGLGKNDYGNSGIFYAWFLAPKIKYCLVIDDIGIISAKRTFKGYSEEHRMIKLEEYISLSEGKTVSGRFSIDWTKTFEGIKIPHRKQNCSECDNRKICSDCIIKPKMNCFNCEMEKACKSCLDLISQKKTYSTDINTLKRKPPNEYHQMLPHYQGVYEPKQNNINFESAKEILMKEDYKMVVKRRFERIYTALESMDYTKYEDISENKEIFVYGIKHVKTDKIDNYILIGCESDELFENDKLFNFWSNKYINNEIEKRNFQISGWPFITLVKRNNFFKIQSIIS